MSRAAPSDSLPEIVLKRGREGPAVAGHPWVFSGAVARVLGTPADGDEVRVRTHDGLVVGHGLFNGLSQIRVRLYRRGDGPVDASFLRERLDEAVSLRRELGLLENPRGACRLVFSEGDGLSGLVVDRFGSHLVVQCTSLALHRRLPLLVEHLAALLSPGSVVLRTEKGVLAEEGLELRDGVMQGSPPDGEVEIEEDGLRFGVDVRVGQKTGFYLDQRRNRVRASSYAAGRDVADVCCYTGAFGIRALAAGARSVTAVDTSERALEAASRNAARNGVAGRLRVHGADAFRWLEAQAEADRRYGMVVLDPPRFARSRRGVAAALRAYRRLNRLALQVLEPEGVLVTCSCSGRVSAGDFLGAVARAGADEGRRLQVLEQLGQSPDHPVDAACPESAYLKCLICRVP